MTISSLNERFGIESIAEFSHGEGGLTCLNLSPPEGSAQVYLHGAHVTGFAPKDEEPVLWMSGKSDFADGKPIRGGVPVCLPWFGPHASDASLPSHGFARLSEWNVESVERTDMGCIARLSTVSNAHTHTLWPFEFKATSTIEVGSSLIMSLEVQNTGNRDFTFTEALHSYFAVSDIRFVSVDGLDGVSYIDKLLESDEESAQRGSIQFTAETDRPYLDTDATCIIDDPGNGRQIVVEKSGSDTTVVWNPWIAKSRRMEDFGDDEWTGMVCVETANALRNAVSLATGESHTMTAVLSVRHT